MTPTLIEDDLPRLALQEERLQFKAFDANAAWTIGSKIRTNAEARQYKVSIDIQVNGQQVFFTMTPGTSSETVDWVRRKRNVVQLCNRSSYSVGLSMRQGNVSLTDMLGLPKRDYATNGGCFPIRLIGTGTIGSITVAGLPERLDHGLVIEAVAEFLGQSLAEVALIGDKGIADQ